MWLLRILRIVAILTPFVPARAGYVLCTIAGSIYFLFNIRARRNILANVEHVDPRMIWAKREFTALRVCITVVTNYYDLLRLRSVDRDRIMDQIELDGIDHVDRALEAGRGAVIVSGHVGNFSVMARLPAALGYRAALIAERVDPPALYNYMGRLRSGMGIEVIPPGPRALRSIINLLNDNGLLLLAADRDVTSKGVPVTFFNRRTTLPVGPVGLAMRTGSALIPAYTLRIGGNRSKVVIQPAIPLQETGDWEHDIESNLQLLAQHLESMITRDPGQWAVLQRVWPPVSSFGRSEGMGSADDALGRGSSSSHDQQ